MRLFPATGSKVSMQMEFSQLFQYTWCQMSYEKNLNSNKKMGFPSASPLLVAFCVNAALPHFLHKRRPMADGYPPTKTFNLLYSWGLSLITPPGKLRGLRQCRPVGTDSASAFHIWLWSTSTNTAAERAKQNYSSGACLHLYCRF